MRWMQALVFCGTLIYAAVDDIKRREVSDLVWILIMLSGLNNLSPDSIIGAIFAAVPFLICAGFHLMGGGDWRLLAAVGFVLGYYRTAAGFILSLAALLLYVLIIRVTNKAEGGLHITAPMVPFFAAGFIPAYFI